jgi:hypothetical protein
MGHAGRWRRPELSKHVSDVEEGVLMTESSVRGIRRTINNIGDVVVRLNFGQVLKNLPKNVGAVTSVPADGGLSAL